MYQRLRSFWQSRDGTYAVAIAVTLPLLLGAIGFAIDIGTMSKAKRQLQDSLDAAILAASRIDDDADSRQKVFSDYFAANLADRSHFKTVEARLSIDRGLNYITTTATAKGEVDLNFAFVFGGGRYVSAQNKAFESTNKLEVALVLDNTGSMGDARMKSLRSAATALVDILATAQTHEREVRAALVPFVTAVNVKGAEFKDSWIDRDAKAAYHGANFALEGGKRVNHLDLFERLGQTWKGCVEARPSPYNLNDAPPDNAVPDTLFVPYFAPDEPGTAKVSGDKGDKFNNSYLDETTSGSQLDQQRSTGKYNKTTYNKIDNVGPLTNGPNYACPTPIQPLTDDMAALKAEIAKMIYWNGSGTNVAEGLAWGMRVLSPEEPYTGGSPFKQEDVSKVVVVFTDGENNVFGASSEGINKSDYGSYSFVDQGRMGSTNRNTALTNVNTYTLAVCTALKAQDVRVFTVLLGADTAANRTLYSKCASNPSDYYPTSDVSTLEATFKKIGAAVASLQMTH